ncbi:MAG TPA: metalloregulator ArsR/SmtB family transcription factor [Chthoniobacteraceae bacterium]
MVNHSAALDSVFSALADPTRRRILVELQGGSASVGRLAKPFKVSAPAISRHLRLLERTGLIRRRRRGRIHEIELNPQPLRVASDWLATYRRFWEDNLEALARYLESSPESPSDDDRREPKKAKKAKPHHQS